MSYLEKLNPNQKKAVQATEGPLLVVAGAGSGKTRVLTHRIAHLLDAQGVPPYSILAVTFTNKAAQEMGERLQALVGPSGKRVTLGTFHSVCVRILHAEGEKSGYNPNFQIYDTSDQLALIRECQRELNIDPQRFNPRQLLAAISRAKDELISADQYKKQALDFWEVTVAKVYQLYQKKLKENNALDFDDLIMVTINMFQDHPAVLAKYQDRFAYILVDEYQDTNHAQYVLVRLLAQKSGNLCVVGDEDQSIYAFRGADIRNILEFEKDFPGARVIKLEENYRSTKNILEAANSVIKNNAERKEKILWTNKDAGAKVGFFQGDNEWAEARFITDAIRGLQGKKGFHYGEFALLYRTHALSRVFEEEFIRQGIPYRIVSGLRFYDRREIKDLIAYLRLIYNPQDNFSFRRVINVPKRGIGEMTCKRLSDYAQEFGISLYDSLAYLGGIDGLGARFSRALGEFKTMLDNLIALQEELALTELTELVLVNSGYLADLERQGDGEALSRRENLQEFLSVTKQFERETPPGDLGSFLEHVALISDVDTYDEGAAVVNLMTLHASKGLEFPVVFVCGMEEGIFPHARSLEEPGQLEEERRLAYVGMTRAQDHLYLSCAKVRTLYGSTKRMLVSPFIEEVAQGLLQDYSKATTLSHLSGIRPPQKKENAGGGLAYKAGDKVEHKAWGRGLVVSVKDSHGDLQLSIVFEGHGLKTVIAHYAPLVKL